MNNDILEYLRSKYADQKPGLFDVDVANSTTPTPSVTPPPAAPDYTPNLSVDDIGKDTFPDIPLPTPTPEMFSSEPFSLNSTDDVQPTIPQAGLDAPTPPATPPPPAGGMPTPATPPIAPPAPISPPSAPIPGPDAKPTADPLAGFTPADRAKVVSNNATSGRELAGEALAGIGDSISKAFGRGHGGHLENTLEAVRARKAGALSNFDKNAALAKGNYEVARQIVANNRADVDRAQMADPTSPVSKAQQALLDKIEPGVDHSKITALQAEVIAKPMLEGYKITEQSKNRKMMSEYLMNKKDEDVGTKFEQDMNASKARAGALGDNQKRLNASERVLNLIDQVKGNPNAMQTPELAQAVGSLISSGSGVVNQTQIEHLMPQSLKGNINKLEGFLTNNPRGLEQQEFIKSYLHTAERERDLITRQLAIAQAKSASGYIDYIRRNPEKARAKLEAQNIPEPMIQKILAGDFKGLDEAAPLSAPAMPKMPTHDDSNAPASMPSLAPNEMLRRAADGRMIVFDKATKQPLREANQ